MDENNFKPAVRANESKISAAIRLACDRRFGVLDSNFLCQSISILNPKMPVCVNAGDTLSQVVDQLRKNKIGCVVVVDLNGRVSGIFTERDYILKIAGKGEALYTKAVGEFMSVDPVCESPDVTIAYVLNLMSQGGFRHIPIVGSDKMPIGIISVKDVVDYIVNSFIEDVLNFPTIVE